jgi:hypothetical protein
MCGCGRRQQRGSFGEIRAGSAFWALSALIAVIIALEFKRSPPVAAALPGIRSVACKAGAESIK